MGKYAADMEIGYHRKVFEAEIPYKLVWAMDQYHDLDCLLRMGEVYEEPANMDAVKRLDAFIEKAWDGEVTMQDIAALDIRMSVGSLVCNEISEGEEAVEQLKAKGVKTAY